ncbi:putative adenylyl cyclase CyaB [Lacibacter cauensis]|uniref:Putative adenylyl cyclase CyaB n=1 Tax=Lacibacter cauensis TaxID=510947 RepID=A0A562SUF3_9BACT|nr:class IV adenylate cyclase [Lacibacter cauensis]TWI84935.1 putative adenylyl cyclase CyaB [Lacibacter cauensis]
MSHNNIEIKARCADPAFIRAYLQQQQARFVGVDEQTDTYFHVPNGRLKLRQGPIENALIFYNRENKAGPKLSEVQLFQVPAQSDALKALLTKANGVKVVVKKRRAIYFIGNVKFHIDEVEGLGSFVEIEAIDTDGSLGLEKINAQCQYYVQAFQIAETDLLTHSYSDLLLNAS